MNLGESQEMYLETLYVISLQQTEVRSVDLANTMGFSRPSVSRAVNNLKTDGLIAIQSDNTLLLTEKGLHIAQKVYDRHITLKNILIEMGVSEETADEDACRIEHVISDESFDAICSHFGIQK